MDQLPVLWEKLRADPYLKEIFGVLSGALMLTAFVSWSIEYAANLHWSLGLLVTLPAGVLAVWTTTLIASEVRSVSLVFVFFVLSVLLGAIACAGISYVLNLQEWASYGAPRGATIETFRNFYLWTFLDMLPAIEIWEIFPVPPPLQAADAIAGVPVLLFKVFVLGSVFAALRRWWKLNSAAEAG